MGATADVRSIPGSEKTSGGRNGNLLQYSCLGNPMDKGDWATINEYIHIWNKQTNIYIYVSHSVMSDSVTSWTVAPQIPLLMELSRQEYWSGLPCLSPADVSN